MKYRTIRLAIPALLIICSVASATMSQVRRRSTTKQKSAKAEQLSPLTLEQKQFVAGLLDKAKSTELTYQINPSKFADATTSLRFILNSNKISRFPTGPIKTHLIAMIYGYGDAGILWGMITRTGFASTFYEAQMTTLGRDTRLQAIEEIGRRWDINIMKTGLLQAQRRILSRALSLKDKLTLLLARTPTANITTPGLVSSEWIFPKPGMQGRYSDITKTIMYDLGDNIFAGHIELAPGVPAVAVIFPLAAPVPQEELSNTDLALAIAHKVVKLPPVLSDAILKQERDSEYRFRTANGKVVIVALAKDRRLAM